MANYIVLLGPPGAGKGTQAACISEALDIPHISTGDLFRENLRNHTALGERANTFMEKGELVPDSLTIEMVQERLSRSDCANGALMDGFPRTSTQAEAFDEMLRISFNSQVSIVPCIEVEPKKIVDRLSGRLMCRCGQVYHAVSKQPRIVGICDECGSELYQREDDKAETIAKRLEVYGSQTAPLIAYYEAKEILCRVDGDQAIGLVTQQLLDSLKRIA